PAPQSPRRPQSGGLRTGLIVRTEFVYGRGVSPLYMQEALSWMRSNGEETGGEDIARLSPLMHGHINMLGHYTFTLPEDILKGELRALNFNLNNELPS
ncbi:Tn3 family transposase, partial [Enterobacter sp.]